MEFVRVGDHNLPVPSRAPVDGLPGLLLRNLNPLSMAPWSTAIVDTGFTFRLPNGYVGLILSLPIYDGGVPLKIAATPTVYGGAFAVNPAGLSSVKIPMVNMHDTPVEFGHGFALARLVFARVQDTGAILVDGFAGEDWNRGRT